MNKQIMYSLKEI